VKYILIVSTLLFSYFSFGQSAFGIANTVTTIDPKNFTFKEVKFKVLDVKQKEKTYQLGFKGNKIYVINSSGQVQPFKVLSYEVTCLDHGSVVTILATGNNMTRYGFADCFKINSKGEKFEFENIIIIDDAKVKYKNLVANTTLQKL